MGSARIVRVICFLMKTRRIELWSPKGYAKASFASAVQGADVAEGCAASST